MYLKLIFIGLLLLFHLPLFAQTGHSNETGNTSVSIRFPTATTQAHYHSYVHINAQGTVNGYDQSLLLFSGTVKNNKLHGQWRSWYKNGKLLDSGFLTKGVPDGVWKRWNDQGKLVAVRTYNADLLYRIWQDLSLNHPRISRFALTERYKKEGNSVYRFFTTAYSFPGAENHLPSSMEEAVLYNVLLKGPYHPLFMECLHHGFYANYFDNGSVKDSGYYKYGLKNGIWIHKEAPDGSYAKGAYKHGLRYHEWKIYTPDNRLAEIIFYNADGKEVRRKKMKF